MADMTASDLVEQFCKIEPWKRGEQRAPHKPLLVLLALRRWQQGHRGPLPFEDLSRVDDVTQRVRTFPAVFSPRISNIPSGGFKTASGP